MNNLFKAILIILVVAYIISPADFMVGPIDDIIVALIGACCMGKPSNTDYDIIED